MTQPEPSADRGKIIGLQERRLGRTVLRTYRAKADIDDIVPNPRQPRLGPKEDDELQRQIEANEGLFEPLLVEPHPDLPGNSGSSTASAGGQTPAILVGQGREQYRQVPVEVTDRTLTDDERLRVWIYIHRQRKEWDAREKEMVAYQLVEFGRAGRARPTYLAYPRARAGQACRCVRTLAEIHGAARSRRRHHLGARAESASARSS